ncbi:Hypothetical predicted protein [Scomber scombrus]|uniref:Uncharacterized protein n=1 Tax=Scomber scombrus TaxID=13677 RepID=A0AAV1MYC5_SCOSC
MKALHSMWKHKAKGNSAYSSDRQGKDCFFKYRLISDSLKNPVMRLCSSRKTKPSQANYMPGAHMGWLLSEHRLSDSQPPKMRWSIKFRL